MSLNAAQVEPVALPVQADVLVGRDARDDLGLVVLADLLERLDRLVARHDPAFDLEVGLGELVHLLLELREVLGRERPLEREVVVEPVLDDGTDRDLGFRVDRLHGLREQVRGRVTDDLEAVLVLGRDDGDLRVALDQVGGVDELAVDATCQRGLGKARAYAGRELRHGERLLEAALAAVWKGDDDRHRLRSR
jgi:hypothetical protein